MTKKVKLKKPKYILLIWMALPEDFDLYAIPYNETTAEDRKMLRMCHGQFINTVLKPSGYDSADVDRALAILSDKIVASKEWIDEEYMDKRSEEMGIKAEEYQDQIGSWYKYKLDMKNPKTIPRSKVIVSGFVM